MLENSSGKNGADVEKNAEINQNTEAKRGTANGNIIENPYYNQLDGNRGTLKKSKNIVDLNDTEIVTATNNEYYEL